MISVSKFDSMSEEEQDDSISEHLHKSFAAMALYGALMTKSRSDSEETDFFKAYGEAFGHIFRALELAYDKGLKKQNET